MQKNGWLQKTSQALALLLVLSMLLPVLAFAAGIEIQNVRYDHDAGTVSADVYVSQSVYDETYGNVEFSAFSDAARENQLNSVSLSTYSVSGSDYVYAGSLNVEAGVHDVVYLEAVYGPYQDVAEAVYAPAVLPAWSDNARLSASNISRNSLTLTWDEAERATRYLVYQGTQLLNTVTDATYTVTGLSEDTFYRFEIRANNDFGSSEEPLTGSFKTSGNSSSSGSRSGGGGGGLPGDNNGNISADSNGNVNATALSNALANGDVTITITGTQAILPASALVNAPKGATVTVVSDAGSYSLPLDALNLESIAAQLGVDLEDLSVKVTIKKLDGDEAEPVNNAIAQAGATSLADPVEFGVSVEDKDGNSVEITSYGTYVSRTMTLNQRPAGTATVVLYNPSTQGFSFVPAQFNGLDVEFKRTGNSIYTVAQFNKSFADLSNHWAKADVELLANKLIVEGTSATTFEADRGITRAEFAALVVRSLGLDIDTTSSAFSDVRSSDWYAGAVSTAAKAGIIKGYEDGTFRPNNRITREELAAMVVRAMNFAGLDTSLSVAERTQLLSKFDDAGEIVWAHREIAAAIDAGVINGITSTTLGSASEATRAESATMLKRFLNNAGFIN